MLQKLPTAWLQLRHQKVRLIVALAGVVFSVVIVFMQFGLQEALFDSAVRFYNGLEGDCFLLSPRSNALIAMETFPKRRLSQALAFEEVEFVTPIYLGQGQWKNPETRDYWRNIFIVGFDIRYPIFSFPGAEENRKKLELPDVVLYDRDSRAEFGPVVAEFEKKGSLVTEIGGRGTNRRIKVVGLFKMGTSFGSDGNLITSHLNFLRLSPSRREGSIDVGLIKLKPGADAQKFKDRLQNYLPKDVKVFTKQELIDFEKHYWQSSTAIGFVFNLGIMLGIMVGVVVVYQILYTNVSEHLSEYATLKAIGYRHRYLLFLVLQQALFIAVLGYIPGFIISMIQYEVTKQATLLPIAMTFERAVIVLVATIAMCFISGASAVQKLKAADPADIF
ncbi:ABC transporter [Hydrococcus rivularis NIES-593]|uniref:ABC transporter n=1 Tax=Hydrococcus rivularis NIES-593 TaxID=1921803 RepID=A0A1U7HI75_9CYAN|nr:ABC transporter permease DevC [Hydrococcus rivularis]OKH23296.1 ABC transporter [Hydrococcus rivularis NIES-593]